MTRFDVCRYDACPDPKFSILIPTWNNLTHLQSCVDSIRKNSRWRHQIILHINEGTDGTLEWARREQLDHTHSAANAGICYGINAAAELAATDFLVYLNDDMYICPAWDHFFEEEIRAAPDHKFFFSGTLIEPRESGNACVIASGEFGDRLGNFNRRDLLQRYAEFPMADWNGATWPPNLVHRKMWDLVGGLSVEFSPGMYSDPDFSMKLWQAGVRLFKGVSPSRAFHFMAQTTGRIKKNDGRRQFMRKWGLTCGAFMQHYLKVGTPFSGPLTEPEDNLSLRWSRLKAQWL